MLIVKDSMVLIHLGSAGILREACIMFGRVIIPCAVHDEVVEKGIERKHPDALVVKKIIEERLIEVVPVSNVSLMNELCTYGLEGGELECVTLYFQEKAKLIASNDDKVRKLRMILNLNMISSPEIVYMMAKNRAISKTKATDCLLELKKTGWFSRNILDLILEEVSRLG